jgi:hypothetical protein
MTQRTMILPPLVAKFNWTDVGADPCVRPGAHAGAPLQSRAWGNT